MPHDIEFKLHIVINSNHPVKRRRRLNIEIIPIDFELTHGAQVVALECNDSRDRDSTRNSMQY